MTIIYQGKSTETFASTVAAFLKTKGDTTNAVIEYKGEILDATVLGATPLEDGADLNVYRIVSGG
ncbi:MAG: hypothetical protein IKU71_01350 [Kiritimatiellae bacterium]|nr:hypothetical protein [Kiritimatiellia bacterium]